MENVINAGKRFLVFGKFLRFLLFFLFFVKPCFSFVVINEIMYNPPEDDYDFEYIELYSNKTNVSGWYFSGIDFVFPNNTTIENYTIIANTCYDDGEDNDFIDKYNVSCEYEYKGTLANTGENISLFDSKGNLIDSVFYNNSYANGDGNSLQLVNGFWYSLVPTPKRKNFIKNDSDNSCDIKIWITTEKDVYNNSEKIEFYNNLNIEKYNFTIEYWVEDLFGNIVKKKYNTTNLNKKSYTPSIEEREKVFVIKARVYVECSDTNLSNNYVEKIVVVKNNKFINENNESYIKILSIDKKKVRFGDSVNLEVKVYKGNTNKYVVYAYVKNDKTISYKTKIYLYDKNKEYYLKIPIQLKPNCEGRFKEGKYWLYLEGLGKEAKGKLNVEGNNKGMCKTKYLKEKEVVYKKVYNSSLRVEKINPLDEFPEGKIVLKRIAEPIVVYESKEYKIKKLIPFALIFLLTLFSLILVWKR